MPASPRVLASLEKSGKLFAMIKVLVSGSGNMGCEVLAAVAAQEDMQPVGCVDALSTGDYIPVPGHDLVPLGRDAASMMSRLRPDVVVDFSNAEWTPRLARDAIAAGVRLVIGTTGLPQGFVDDLAAECSKRGVGAVVAPNFALGAVLMQHMAKLASRFYSQAEIIEMHHDRKADAPSGTSIATAKAMAAGRGQAFAPPVTAKETLKGTRGGSQDGVVIHSVRLPGLVAHQQVVFGAPGETLTIRHDSMDRASFMPGVVLAVREVMARNELVFGLDRLIGIE
jgi:4-hydroxy-tetrahydrodipicolinate reductase